MESEAGTKVAFYQHPFPPGGGLNGWRQNEWEWDSIRFLARRQNLSFTESATPASYKPANNNNNSSANLNVGNNKRKCQSSDEEEGQLTLKLGGTSGDEKCCNNKGMNNNNSKRHRSGVSPISRPVCQVDGCQTDLATAKDYHRRHKVCEFHAKASRATVGNSTQRFCQQCSRFHPLEEFDEGKRSCRRRLAGHNKRRRKTQNDDIGSRLSSFKDDSNSLGKLDVASIVSALSQQLKANNDKLLGRPTLDEEYVLQSLLKLKNGSSSEDAGVTQSKQAIDLNVSQELETQSSECEAPSVRTDFQQLSGEKSVDALKILSALAGGGTATSVLHNKLMTLENSNLQKKHDQQATSQYPPSMIKPITLQPTRETTFPLNTFYDKVSRGNTSSTVPVFSTMVHSQLPNLAPPRPFLREDKCQSEEERHSSKSQSSSSPVMHKLFPMNSSDDCKDNTSGSVSEGSDATPDQSPVACMNNRNRSLSRRCPSIVPDLRINGYSSSTSEHSPASSSSETSERTSRIVIKLFDKDPSNFPDMLRSQILDWLSHCPSDMESYIRPGCVILTIFASMPSTAWEQLRQCMLERLNSLLYAPYHDFWRNGRLLVQAERQAALFKDGKNHFCKPYKSSEVPEISSICPLAVVAGEETRIVLRGQNLTSPGTKFLFAYRGEYISQMLISEHSDKDSKSFLCSSNCIEHTLSGGPPNVIGRMFVEVERGLKGNSYPVIVADRAICTELRTLEGNFDDIEKDMDVHSSHSTQEEMVTFLNELGWLFQRVSFFGRDAPLPKFANARFKLLLVFSLERSWLSTLHKVLDIFFTMHGERESNHEALNVLHEIRLLHIAVKRKSRTTVDFLLHYVPPTKSSRKPVFRSDESGPGGLTPLHLAASMQNAEGIVDALISDQEKIGLRAWTRALDDNQETPQSYATMADNISYNKLVQDKMADQINPCVSIRISPEVTMADSEKQSNLIRPDNSHFEIQREARSCAQCSRVSMKRTMRLHGNFGSMYGPFIHSLLAVACLCACVCLLFKGPVTVGTVAPFKWENVGYGTH